MIKIMALPTKQGTFLQCYLNCCYYELTRCETPFVKFFVWNVFSFCLWKKINKKRPTLQFWEQLNSCCEWEWVYCMCQDFLVAHWCQALWFQVLMRSRFFFLTITRFFSTITNFFFFLFFFFPFFICNLSLTSPRVRVNTQVAPLPPGWRPCSEPPHHSSSPLGKLILYDENDKAFAFEYVESFSCKS